MTAPAFTDASAHATGNLVVTTLSSIRLGLSWVGAAFARLQEARLEKKMHRVRHRIGSADDEDRPIVGTLKAKEDVR